MRDSPLRPRHRAEMQAPPSESPLGGSGEPAGGGLRSPTRSSTPRLAAAPAAPPKDLTVLVCADGGAVLVDGRWVGAREAADALVSFAPPSGGAGGHAAPPRVADVSKKPSLVDQAKALMAPSAQVTSFLLVRDGEVLRLSASRGDEARVMEASTDSMPQVVAVAATAAALLFQKDKRTAISVVSHCSSTVAESMAAVGAMAGSKIARSLAANLGAKLIRCFAAHTSCAEAAAAVADIQSSAPTVTVEEVDTDDGMGVAQAVPKAASPTRVASPTRALVQRAEGEVAAAPTARPPSPHEEGECHNGVPSPRRSSVGSVVSWIVPHQFPHRAVAADGSQLAVVAVHCRAVSRSPPRRASTPAMPPPAFGTSPSLTANLDAEDHDGGGGSGDGDFHFARCVSRNLVFSADRDDEDVEMGVATDSRARESGQAAATPHDIAAWLMHPALTAGTPSPCTVPPGGGDVDVDARGGAGVRGAGVPTVRADVAATIASTNRHNESSELVFSFTQNLRGLADSLDAVQLDAVMSPRERQHMTTRLVTAALAGMSSFGTDLLGVGRRR